MENDCGCNQKKDQLVVDSKDRANNINMEKELKDQENRNEHYHPSESFI